MKTLFKSLVLTAILAIGSVVAAPTVDLALSRSLNVDNLRDANLTIASEVPSVRVNMDGFRLSLNGMDPQMASVTLGMAMPVVGFDHVNVSLERHTFGLGLSRDASISGALSLTAGVGCVSSNLHNLPTLTASAALVYNVW